MKIKWGVFPHFGRLRLLAFQRGHPYSIGKDFKSTNLHGSLKVVLWYSYEIIGLGFLNSMLIQTCLPPLLSPNDWIWFILDGLKLNREIEVWFGQHFEFLIILDLKRSSMDDKHGAHYRCWKWKYGLHFSLKHSREEKGIHFYLNWLNLKHTSGSILQEAWRKLKLFQADVQKLEVLGVEANCTYISFTKKLKFASIFLTALEWGFSHGCFFVDLIWLIWYHFSRYQ